MFMSDDRCDRRAAMQRIGLATLAGACLGSGREGLGQEDLPVRVGRVPQDRRLGPLLDLNGYFPFQPPSSVEAWEERAEYVRRRILVASGLWPLPQLPPVEAVVHGRVERPGYSVDRVYFQAVPGLYVTGSLYRPEQAEGKLPTILTPHGHWADGRFFAHGDSAMRNELESGGEKYPESGRYPLQARCVQLVRMGCLVFHYDMIGYADSTPFTGEVGHSLRTQREHLTSPDRWGLFSAQSELRLINAFGLQTLSSLRAMDWLCSLPEVDTERIGVTGASGGGTQTFILAAIDSRPAASFPAVMVSTAMQGGCTCENASYLRIGTGNIEFAALSAPRPLGLTAANDWTREIETKGLPELRQHYELLGVPERLEGKYHDFGHNYNYVSRAQMYEFFNRHLQLGWESPIVEEDFEPLTREELTVWTDEHPRPAMDEEAEVQFLRSYDALLQRHLAGFKPHDAESWEQARSVRKGAIDIMVGRRLPDADDLVYENVAKVERDQYQHFVSLLRVTSQGEELPVAFLLPKDWSGKVVLWFSGRGKTALFRNDGRPRRNIQRLLDANIAVGSADLLYTGEFLADGTPLSETRRVDNPREIAAYTLGYNHPLFAQRVHDILTMVAYSKHHEWTPKSICLVGTDDAAPWVAAAAVQAGSAVQKVAVDSGGFRFGRITDIRDPQLWPGAVLYGDLPGLLALCAPVPLWVGGESRDEFGDVATWYRASGDGDGLRVDDASGRRERMSRLVNWLRE
jgi:hypothetical protein